MSHPFIKKLTFAATVGLSCLGAAPVLFATSSAMADDAAALPSAKDVLKRYVEVTGGKEAYSKVKTRVSTGTFKIPSQGIEGKVTATQKAPNKAVYVVDIPNLGKMEQGSDGTTIWSRDPMSGVRILSGSERAIMEMGFDLTSPDDFEDTFSKVETVGVTDVDGKPAYKVVGTLKSAPDVITSYYDKASGLLVKTEMTLKGPMGEVPMVSRIGEYKEFGGLKAPAMLNQTMAGVETIITTDTVVDNGPVDDAVFELPAEVKKLAAKPKPAK